MPTKDGQLNINDVGKLYEMYGDIKYIKMTLDESVKKYDKLNEQVNGNGKPGVRQDIHDIKQWHEKYDYQVDKLISGSENKNYFKKTVIESLRLVGFGTIVTLILRFM